MIFGLHWNIQEMLFVVHRNKPNQQFVNPLEYAGKYTVEVLKKAFLKQNQQLQKMHLVQ